MHHFLLEISMDTHSSDGLIENFLSSLGLSQLISEPTNSELNKNPSGIGLVVTDLPILVLGSGTRASLDSFCHHQIPYCKINFNIPPPPPHPTFWKKIWHYHKANICPVFLGFSTLILTRIPIGKLEHLLKRFWILCLISIQVRF